MSTAIADEIKEYVQKLKQEEKKPLRIALFGQPGAGKSSIINKLVGQKVVQEGTGTDTTVDAQVVDWPPLVLVDLPGYGTSKFPPNEWFTKFEVEKFDLYLCVFSGKIHEADTAFFQDLNKKNRVCIFVRNFTDSLWEDGKTLDELKATVTEDVSKQVGKAVTVQFTSCKDKTGLAELSDAIYARIGQANKEKWVRGAKAYTKEALERKKAAAKKLVKQFSKYVPIVGQAIAALLGFEIVRRAGESYLNDCHEVAASILDNELRNQQQS
jgi:GTP-binding protein EngB required for normal cell division